MQGRTHVRHDPARDARLRSLVEEAAREGRPLTWEVAAARCGFSGPKSAQAAARRLGVRKAPCSNSGRARQPLWGLKTWQRDTYRLARLKGFPADEAFELARTQTRA